MRRLLLLAIVFAAACAHSPAADRTPPSLETLLNLTRLGAPSGQSATDFVYLHDVSGTNQLFARHGKRTVQLTNYPDRISSYRLSPDGKRLVFLKDQGGDENDQLYLLDLATSAIRPLTASPKIKHTLPTFDSKGERLAFTSTARNGKDFDLYVVPVVGEGLLQQPPTVELSGSYSVPALDGDRVLLVEAKSNVDQVLSLYDLAAKKQTALTPHSGDELLAGARFSADRKAVYALSDRGSEFVRLIRIELATTEQKPIYEQPFDLEQLVVDPTLRSDGEHLLVVTNQLGIERPILLSVTGGATGSVVTARPTTLAGFAGDARFSLDGKSVLLGFEQPTDPSAIYAIEWSSGKAQRLTDRDASIAGQRFASAELARFQSSDGHPIDYFWYGSVSGTPQRKQPVVILIHGGPEGQTKVNFSPIIQYLATHGIAVAAPNVRGSTGYGKSFSHLDDKEKREDSVRDIAELADALSKRPDVDAKRLAVYGGSYGGYMVLASLTLYPKLWAAGVDIVGIANYRTFLEQTAPYRRALREAEYGSLATDGALLDRISPIHKVDQIAAPLFLVHGARDPRVPVGETKQIQAALTERGLPVELLIYEDEGHGLAKRKNRLDAYPKVMKFLAERLGAQ